MTKELARKYTHMPSPDLLFRFPAFLARELGATEVGSIGPNNFELAVLWLSRLGIIRTITYTKKLFFSAASFLPDGSQTSFRVVFAAIATTLRVSVPQISRYCNATGLSCTALPISRWNQSM